MIAGASITIGGAPIPSRWDGTDLVAVNGLSIVWGRTDPYDQPEPGILTMQLVDRRGTFLTDSNRVGQQVVVSSVTPAAVKFRGTISRPKARRARVHNPLTNADETVWIVTITASDVLANLAGAVFAGDAIDGWVEGAGGWSEARTAVRLSRLYDAGANGLVDGIETLPQILPANVDRMMHGQAAKDARTALELIQQVYRTHPLGVAGYNPETNTIVVGQFATSSPVVLQLTAGRITLNLTAGLVVPASRVGIESYEVESTVADAIDVVQIGYQWYGKDPALTAGAQKRTIYTTGFIEGRTNRYDPRSRRVLRLDTEDITYDPTEFTAGSVDAFNRFPAWLRDQVLAIVNSLNNQLRLPNLRFDADRMPLGDVEAMLYRPVAQAIPLYFAGSIFNGMQHVGPQFQIIGGTLRYDNGWTHDVTLCATQSNTLPALTLAQLVTNPTPTIADFDPDISLADLGLVTTGLA